MHRLQKFATDFVKVDGVFVLRMLNLHAGLLFTADLIQALKELHEISGGDVGVLEFIEEHPFEKLTSSHDDEVGEAEKMIGMEKILLPLSVHRFASKVSRGSPDSLEFSRKPKRRFFKEASF